MKLIPDVELEQVFPRRGGSSRFVVSDRQTGPYANIKKISFADWVDLDDRSRLTGRELVSSVTISGRQAPARDSLSELPRSPQTKKVGVARAEPSPGESTTYVGRR